MSLFLFYYIVIYFLTYLVFYSSFRIQIGNSKGLLKSFLHIYIKDIFSYLIPIIFTLVVLVILGSGDLFEYTKDYETSKVKTCKQITYIDDFNKYDYVFNDNQYFLIELENSKNFNGREQMIISQAEVLGQSNQPKLIIVRKRLKENSILNMFLPTSFFDEVDVFLETPTFKEL